MKIEAIDSVLLAVRDLDAACGPYERLGRKLSGARDGHRTLSVGGPADLFTVHFLAATAGPLALPWREAIAASRPLFAVAKVVVVEAERLLVNCVVVKERIDGNHGR